MSTTLPPLSASSAADVTGDRERFLRSLLAEAHAHPALHHPWLLAVANGTLPDRAGALRDFAWSYQGYSAWFPRYLRAVISRLARPEHRELLLENLAEEGGQLADEDRSMLRRVGIVPETVDGVPHPELFRRFCRAMGIGPREMGRACAAAVAWRTRFLIFLQRASAPAAVGALGLGTESIVKPMYQRILEGITRLPGLRRDDWVFFELHCVVDEQHELDLLEVAGDLARTPAQRAELRRGMLYALRLRQQYWDALLDRAMAGPREARA